MHYTFLANEPTDTKWFSLLVYSTSIYKTFGKNGSSDCKYYQLLKNSNGILSTSKQYSIVNISPRRSRTNLFTHHNRSTMGQKYRTTIAQKVLFFIIITDNETYQNDPKMNHHPKNDPKYTNHTVPLQHWSSQHKAHLFFYASLSP